MENSPYQISSQLTSLMSCVIVAEMIKVATVSELTPGSCKEITIQDKTIALFNVDGQFYAIANRCPHRGGPLSESSVMDKIITCPWHGWQFDVTTGCAPTNPDVKVETYEVKTEGDAVFVRVD